MWSYKLFCYRNRNSSSNRICNCITQIHVSTDSCLIAFYFIFFNGIFNDVSIFLIIFIKILEFSLPSVCTVKSHCFFFIAFFQQMNCNVFFFFSYPLFRNTYISLFLISIDHDKSLCHISRDFFCIAFNIFCFYCIIDSFSCCLVIFEKIFKTIFPIIIGIYYLSVISLNKSDFCFLSFFSQPLNSYWYFDFFYVCISNHITICHISRDFFCIAFDIFGFYCIADLISISLIIFIEICEIILPMTVSIHCLFCLCFNKCDLCIFAFFTDPSYFYWYIDLFGIDVFNSEFSILFFNLFLVAFNICIFCQCINDRSSIFIYLS